LQRCLQEGDIPRATQAWSMLLRVQVGGEAIDLRTSGYWGIGAELLARSLDVTNGPAAEGEVRGYTRKRWGTGEGLKKAIGYYQTLINTYPYRRMFPNAVGAMDFWPAMLGCKIYGVQLEQREALQNIAEAEKNEIDDDLRDDDDSIGEMQDFVDDGGFAAEEVRRLRRHRRREEKRWDERDEIRRTALAVSGEIAATLKDLMISKEYYSHALRRLRGMLALYVGDLSIPALPIEYNDTKNEEKLNSRQLVARRMLFRQREDDYEEGKIKQDAERALAKEMFDTIKAEGGYVGGNIDFLYPEEEQEQFHDAEEW